MNDCLIHPSGRFPGRSEGGPSGLFLPVARGMVILTLLVTGCRPSLEKVDKVDPTVVAEVGGRRITTADVLAEARLRAGNRRSVPEKEELLREMISREAILQRAVETGIDQDPVVRREMENILIRHLLAAELDPRREAITVSTNEVAAEFTAHPDRFGRLAQVRLAILFRAVAPKASEANRSEVRRRLEEVVAQAAAGRLPSANPGVAPGFGALAAEVSEDQVSRYRGGDIGWLTEGQSPSRIPSRVIETGRNLPQGRVSDVLEEADGYYVIMKTDSRDAGRVSLASVEPTLRQSILVRKRKEAEEAFHAETARRFPPRIHTDVLETLTLPEATAALRASNRQSQPPVLPGTTDSHHGN